MEESGIEKGNGHTPRGLILRSRFSITAYHLGLFAPFQFFGYQIRNCLFKQYSLVSDDPLRVAGIVTDGIVLKGGDGSMH